MMMHPKQPVRILKTNFPPCSYPYLVLIVDAHVDMSRVRLIRLLFQKFSDLQISLD
jgi:hypothetical protein